jgi:hypothetical protein
MRFIIRKYLTIVAGLVLIAPAASHWFIGTAQAQPGFPSNRPPSYQPPKFPSYQPPKMPSYQPPKMPSYQPPSSPFGPGGTNKPFNQGPVFVTTWHCTRCNAQLGTGNVKPALSSCPSCKARLVGGTSGGSSGGGGGTLIMNKNSNPANAGGFPPTNSGGSTPASRGGTANPLLIPVVIGGGFVGLLAIGAVITLVAIKLSKPKRRRKRRKLKRRIVPAESLSDQVRSSRPRTIEEDQW